MSRFVPPSASGGWRRVPLLEADPDLGRGLSERRLAGARSRVMVRRFAPKTAVWCDEALNSVVAGGLGVLVLDGILAREVVMSDNLTTELVGAGDLPRSSSIGWPVEHIASA